MTGEEALGWFIGLLQDWGPLVLIIFAVFVLLILSFIIYVFVSIVKSNRQMDRDFRPPGRRR